MAYQPYQYPPPPAYMSHVPPGASVPLASPSYAGAIRASPPVTSPGSAAPSATVVRPSGQAIYPSQREALPTLPDGYSLKDLIAMAAVDATRTLAVLLCLSPTLVFRAATIVHRYVATSTKVFTPADERSDTIYFIAAGALLAATKVESCGVRLRSIVHAVDVIRRRRANPRLPMALDIPESTLEEVTQIRNTIIQHEWDGLEASGFYTTSELPHLFALVLVRAVTDASAYAEDEEVDESAVDDDAAPKKAAPKAKPATPGGISNEGRRLLQYVLSMCNDCVRSRKLCTEIPAPVVATAAFARAVRTCLPDLDADQVLAVDGWYKALDHSIEESEVNEALKEFDLLYQFDTTPHGVLRKWDELETAANMKTQFVDIRKQRHGAVLMTRNKEPTPAPKEEVAAANSSSYSSDSETETSRHKSRRHKERKEKDRRDEKRHRKDKHRHRDEDRHRNDDRHRHRDHRRDERSPDRKRSRRDNEHRHHEDRREKR